MPLIFPAFTHPRNQALANRRAFPTENGSHIALRLGHPSNFAVLIITYALGTTGRGHAMGALPSRSGKKPHLAS